VSGGLRVRRKEGQVSEKTSTDASRRKLKKGSQVGDP
jgi:hypothetical protein